MRLIKQIFPYIFFVYLGTLARPRVITFCAKLKAYIGARLPKKEAK
jgi:hypothetical protein